MPFSRSMRSSRATSTIVSGAVTALLALVGLPANGQSSAPQDWPCVQAYIPEIRPATFWPAPIDDALVGTWREDPDIAALARRLGEAEQMDEGTLAAIDTFANAVPESERREALTRVADGTVSVADERRSSYLDGIRRYTRQQIAIAGQIESTLNRMAMLDESAAAGGTDAASAGESPNATPGDGSGVAADDEVAVSLTERAEMQETLDWHERLYDQRERSIRALCERPVELEQRLSEVLRELAYRLPNP